MNLEQILDKTMKESPDGVSQETIGRVRKLVRYELENPGKNKPYRSLEDIDDFVLYHNLHPEWEGKYIAQMRKDKESGALAFYAAFKNWAKNTAKTEEERKALTQKIFKPKHNNWSSYKTIDDWIGEYNQHSEWQGKSTADMVKDTESGANAFYAAFNKWVNKTTKTEEKRKALTQKIFEPKLKDWSSYKTIDDWIGEYNQHSEWQGKSASEMQKDTESGANAFYAAFKKWANKTTKTEEERKDLTQKIFKPKETVWSSYKTIDDWIGEYNQHSEWQVKSTEEMGKDKESGASAFYAAFNKWVRNSTQNKEKRKALTQKIFKPKHNNWSSYKIIDDWIGEYNRHLEWKGKSTEEMGKDKESGASAFYASFSIWAKNTAKTEKERKAYVRAIFPERNAPFKYSFGNGENHFDSYPERIVAILLNHYGLVDDFIEGENLHVRTNGNKLNSIDFLVNETFIEFHPLGIADNKNGLTLEQAGERKKKNITNPEYTSFGFHHIWDINQLYDVLRNNNLMNGSRNLSKKQFEKDKMLAYKKAIGYDKLGVAK